MIDTFINGKYHLMLPEHRAKRPEWDINNGGWEVKRIDMMVHRIKQHHKVFYIGAEEGDIAALIAKYTGAGMVLVEPNDKVWSCIKVIWDANQLDDPLFFYGGFFSNMTRVGKRGYPSFQHIPLEGGLITDHSHKLLHDDEKDIPQIRLDDFCESSRIYPSVICMDVEGSEWEVLKGAEKTLREIKPMIFLSAHPEFMYIHFKQWLAELRGWLIRDLGYKERLLEYPLHEIHFVYD